MQLFLFLFPLQHIKRPALQNKQAGVLQMAFRARKAFGTFGKRAPGPCTKEFHSIFALFKILSGVRFSLLPTTDPTDEPSVFLPLSLRLEEMK